MVPCDHAGVFVRVWEYEVPPDRTGAFDARLEGIAAAERSVFEGSS